jgi:hypothetical protein
LHYPKRWVHDLPPLYSPDCVEGEFCELRLETV